MKYTEALDQQLNQIKLMTGNPNADRYIRYMLSTGRLEGVSPRSLANQLKSAHTYYVSEEICDLVGWSWTEMPKHPLLAEHLPSPYGWAWMERPYTMSDVHGNPVTHRAISWGQGKTTVGDDGIVVVMYGDMDTLTERERELLEDGDVGSTERMRRAVGRIHPVHTMSWVYGADWSSNESIEQIRRDVATEGRDPDKAVTSFKESYGWLTAFWAIICQDIGRPDVVEAPRQARKRAKREGRESSSINVVHLRRNMGGQEEEIEEVDEATGKRRMKVRYYVKPHWRRQWYPKQGVHRLILIPPQIRGPAGAPLSDRSTIKVVDR